MEDHRRVWNKRLQISLCNCGEAGRKCLPHSRSSRSKRKDSQAKVSTHFYHTSGEEDSAYQERSDWFPKPYTPS